MKILFICRHNRFRSKIAEAYFNKINKNKNLVAKSAGIFPGSEINKTQIDAAKKFGVEIGGKPRAITSALLKWNDVIIGVTDDLPKGLFNYANYKPNVIEWKISDDYTGKEKAIDAVIKKIIKKVDEFVEERKND